MTANSVYDDKCCHHTCYRQTHSFCVYDDSMFDGSMNDGSASVCCCHTRFHHTHSVHDDNKERQPLSSQSFLSQQHAVVYYGFYAPRICTQQTIKYYVSVYFSLLLPGERVKNVNNISCKTAGNTKLQERFINASFSSNFCAQKQ